MAEFFRNEKDNKQELIMENDFEEAVIWEWHWSW
jgi:hypothetical protein